MDFDEPSVIEHKVIMSIVQAAVGIASTAPSGLKVAFDPATPGQVALSWTPPLEGATNYQVEWSDTYDGIWNVVPRAASATPSQVLTGMPSFASLQWRVATVKDGVVGAYTTSAPKRLFPKAYAADSFNAADGVLVAASDGRVTVPWNDRDGAGFSRLEGGIRPTVIYANSVRKALTVDVPGSEGALQWRYTKAPPVATDISTAGLLLRYVDASNYVVLDMTSAGLWRLRKRVAGAYSTIIDNIGPVAVGDVMLVQWKGNAYIVTLNDRTPVKGVDSGSSFLTATPRGLLQPGGTIPAGGGTPMKWDDFQTWEFAW